MSEENRTFATEEEVKPDLLENLPDLKALREVRGLTIEDIFLKTRINATFLNAIESGEFHLLPSPLYAKKFIVVYAEIIGIDAGVILARYQRYLDEKQAVPEEAKADRAQIIFDRKPKPLKRYLLYALPAMAIIAIIIYAFFPEQEPGGIIQHSVAVDERKEVVPKPAPDVKERPLETVDNPPPTPPPVITRKETTQTPGNARLNLLIEATENTWLNITEDHNPPYQISLKPGGKLNRNAREFFIVDVGNAAGVNITFQGKSLGNLGLKGQVVHLRLPQQ